MLSPVRINYLVSKGDYAVNRGRPSGTQILTGSAANPFDVLSGELVVFDAKSNALLDAADIPNAEWVSIAVGVGKEGQLAKQLRYIGGVHINLCNFQLNATAEPPTCGRTEEVDVFVADVQCGDNKPIIVYLDDYIARSWFAHNERIKYIFQAEAPCKDCDECSPADVCHEWVCRIVDQINGDYQPDPTKVSFFQNRRGVKQYQPFRAIKLFNQADSLKTFCLTPTQSQCIGCDAVEAVVGIRINGTDHMFTNTYVPGTPNKTLLTQLDIVIDEIKKVIEPLGWDVYLGDGVNSCCNKCIKISACGNPSVPVIELLTGDPGSPTVKAPDVQENPFTTQTVQSYCKDCTGSSTNIPYQCGFRILVDPVKVSCLCDMPPDQVPNFYGRHIEVTPYADEWDCSKFYSVVVDEGEAPRNFGFFWKDAERWQSLGGGVEYSGGDRYHGKKGFIPDAYSKIWSTTVDCEEMYCVYNLEFIKNAIPGISNAPKTYNKLWGFVLIPTGDNTTKSSWEGYLTELLKRGNCNAPTVTCNP